MENSIVEKSVKKEYLKSRRIIYFKYFSVIYIILCILFLVVSNNSEHFSPNISDRLLFLFPILIPSLIFASYCVGEGDEKLISDEKFYSECSNKTKELFKEHFSEKAFIEKTLSIFEQEIN
jgi:hypothetical protein